MPPSAFSADLSAILRAVAEPRFLGKLQRLRLAVPHKGSQQPGSTPVPRASQASGMEFTDHKMYTPGDDLRHVDWHVYARLDQKLVKRFRTEREAPLHLLIDTSASMGVPVADGKLPFAAGLAASLAYISLRRCEPVRAVAIRQGDQPAQVSPLLRHARRLGELQAFLSRLEAGGATSLTDGIEAYLRTTRLLGIAVVLSDFLVPAPIYQRALECLYARGYGVAAVRLLGPHERDPGGLPRRVRVRDVESGNERVVDLTEAHRLRYTEALQSHLTELRRWCEARAITYAVADTGEGIEPCLLSELPRVGLLQ